MLGPWQSAAGPFRSADQGSRSSDPGEPCANPFIALCLRELIAQDPRDQGSLADPFELRSTRQGFLDIAWQAQIHRHQPIGLLFLSFVFNRLHFFTSFFV